MDYAAIVGAVLDFLSHFSFGGAIIAVIVGALAFVQVLSTVVTSFVGLWHAVVSFLLALGKLPGIGPAFQSIGASLQVEESKIDADANQILAIIAQLSSIPLPKLPSK